MEITEEKLYEILKQEFEESKEWACPKPCDGCKTDLLQSIMNRVNEDLK